MLREQRQTALCKIWRAKCCGSGSVPKINRDPLFRVSYRVSPWPVPWALGSGSGSGSDRNGGGVAVRARQTVVTFTFNQPARVSFPPSPPPPPAWSSPPLRALCYDNMWRTRRIGQDGVPNKISGISWSIFSPPTVSDIVTFLGQCLQVFSGKSHVLVGQDTRDPWVSRAGRD